MKLRAKRDTKITTSGKPSWAKMPKGITLDIPLNDFEVVDDYELEALLQCRRMGVVSDRQYGIDVDKPTTPKPNELKDTKTSHSNKRCEPIEKLRPVNPTGDKWDIVMKINQIIDAINERKA